MAVQHKWTACQKCQALYYGGDPNLNAPCPAGGIHDPAGSFAYEVEFNAANRNDFQQAWSSCSKCRGLYYSGFAAAGVCPAGGGHSKVGSFAYGLPFGLPASSEGQTDWKACSKCLVLYYGPHFGKCPAGGTHADANSFNYRVGCTGISNFTFDQGISVADRMWLTDLHRRGIWSINDCSNLSATEKGNLFAVYRKNIHHGFDNTATNNASSTVGGTDININFVNMHNNGDTESAQTLIHELMHCAGYTHPTRRDPPPGVPCTSPTYDCPGDNGVYYGTPPLRAEVCIAGSQSDLMRCTINTIGGLHVAAVWSSAHIQ